MNVHGSLPVYQRQAQPSCIRRLVVIARRLRKMNKPTPPLGIPSVARFHSEICRNCHVFDGPGDSTGGAHLNMKEEE